ncbi:hypothetical protein PVMG_05994 [Plasmodium vivax Mauritania I]|uniref:Pv-fam-c protein n=1 Tax=Plasmodium vivax Mauritania I TaxID=1035515 RepID=A0A0J9T412_PLAVI|nr:hypothetical protein PVMG_05994 [Plasmodium vivax Mauritania I]
MTIINRRNINIIHGVKFGAILTHIHNKNKDDIDSWINGYKNKLTEYLNKNPQIWNKDPGKYCTNLNYIIDFIVQGINNLKMIEGIRWALRVQEISRDTLRKITSSKCTRDLDNFENKNLLFKKLMLDLCEDIEFIKKKIKILPYNKCLRVISRLKYRNDTLMKLYHTFVNKSIFDLKDKCSISFIYNNLSNINCNKGQEQPSVTGSFERGTVTASSSAVRADTQVEGKIKETKEEEALETESLQDSGFGDGLDNTEPVYPNLEDLQIGLPDNEDPPKLDTTYAAASLAGVSLFGTILYKVKYHYIKKKLCKIFLFYINNY